MPRIGTSALLSGVWPSTTKQLANKLLLIVRVNNSTYCFWSDVGVWSCWPKYVLVYIKPWVWFFMYQKSTWAPNLDPPGVNQICQSGCQRISTVSSLLAAKCGNKCQQRLAPKPDLLRQRNSWNLAMKIFLKRKHWGERMPTWILR